MREIKFRAKALDGLWEYGDLHLHCYHPYMHNIGGAKIYIDPDTVGQFTGLHDKNGKEIYEGDIMRRENLIYYVDWHKYLCKFYFSFGEEQTINDIYTNICMLERMGYSYEVIGNIHDNPELLKGE